MATLRSIESTTLELRRGSYETVDFYFMEEPGLLTTAYAAGDATVYVTSTDGAAATGAIWVQPKAASGEKDPPGFWLTYTGVTPTTYTGCSASGAYSSTAMAAAVGCEVAPVVSLSGYTATLVVRPAWSSLTASLTLTSSPAAGLTITAGTGKVAAVFTAAQTEALTRSEYVWGIELTDGSGHATEDIHGPLYMIPQAVQ